MEDETQAATAVVEAPLTDAAVASTDEQTTTAQAVGQDGLPELAPDLSNVDAWLAASEAAINAEAARSESAVASDPTDTAASPEAAAVPSSGPAVDAPPAAEQPAPDYTRMVADLQARGFKVEPPAPPPDPFAELRNELAPYVGNERYEQLQAVALQELPAEPAAYDAATVEAHEAKVREVNAAKAELKQMAVNRKIHGASYAWARQQVLADAGAELGGMADKYGADPARVQSPKSVADAVDAVAEAVASRKDAEWQAKYDARERYWAGKVKQAQADASVDRHRAIGTAPAASPPPGGAAPIRPGASLFELDSRGLPTEASIQRAIRGDFAHVDLSDR